MLAKWRETAIHNDPVKWLSCKLVGLKGGNACLMTGETKSEPAKPMHFTAHCSAPTDPDLHCPCRAETQRYLCKSSRMCALFSRACTPCYLRLKTKMCRCWFSVRTCLFNVYGRNPQCQHFMTFRTVFHHKKVTGQWICTFSSFLRNKLCQAVSVVLISRGLWGNSCL